MNRRDWLQMAGTAALGMSGSSFLLTEEYAEAAAKTATGAKSKVVTLVHTNDTHSRIDPYTKGKYKGLGGIARRATMISQVRQQNPATLVLDAGDFFQGTPYFNMFKGRIELMAMSQCGYHYATLGNHDFDLGGEWLLTALSRHARFPILCANLDFQDPRAEKLIRPYAVRMVGGRKIGIIGLCIQLEGLVAGKLWKGVKYKDPLLLTKQLVSRLRKQEKCDAVVVLSHLGYTPYRNQPSDQQLARNVDGIDVIIGGHTHTFLMTPKQVTSVGGHKTRIYQVGHSGLVLGQIDLVFDDKGGVSTYDSLHPINPRYKFRNRSYK